MNITITVFALFGVLETAQSVVSGPYTPDSYTLHLYHFDGNATDSITHNPVDLTLGNGATISSLSIDSFGTALNTSKTGSSPYAAAAILGLPIVNFIDVTTGAFTFEAIIRPEVDLSLLPNHMEIICADTQRSGITRGWQFRINKSGNLEWNGLAGGGIFQIPLPTVGDHSYEVGTWYHVAVTYNGNPSDASGLKLYWTKLNADVTEAQLLGQTSGNKAQLTLSSLVDFSIGNEIRGTPNENFEGFIDEVRISSIARTPDDMLFIDNDLARPVILVNPSNATIPESQTALFVTIFLSESTPVVQWFKVDSAGDIELSSTNPDILIVTSCDTEQYTTTLEITNTKMAFDPGLYYCKINNDSNLPRYSRAAKLTLLGLVAQWTFDQSDFISGQYIDNVKGIPATVTGTPVFVYGSDGHSAGAVQVGPTSGWANVVNFNLDNTGQFSISLWVNWEQTSQAAVDLSITNISGDDAIIVADCLAAGKWRHICIVYDSAVGKLYINGVLRAQGAFVLPQDSVSTLEIGSAAGYEVFNGYLDDLRIYNQALSDADIMAIYHEMVGGCGLPFDFSGPDGRPDCKVDIYDLQVFAEDWIILFEYADLSDFSRVWLSNDL